MIRVKIAGRDNGVKNSWDDVTLEEFSEVCQLPIPERLRERYAYYLSGDRRRKPPAEDSYEDIVKTFPRFYGQVIALLSDIPPEVIDQIEWSVRTTLYQDYLLHIVETVLSSSPLIINDDGKIDLFTGQGAESVIFDGERYQFPKSLRFADSLIPLSEEKIITFAEASDIQIALHEWATQGVHAMAQVAAVYLRKEGEEYSEQLTIERMEKFRILPMSVVWELFFCMTRLGGESMNDILSSLREALLGGSHQERAKELISESQV